jgi:hypothetical protein
MARVAHPPGASSAHPLHSSLYVKTRAQRTRVHFCPQHLLLCHLGLYKPKFEFDHHLQRGRQLQRSEPPRESLRLVLAGASCTYCLPRLNLVSNLISLLVLPRAGGRGNRALGSNKQSVHGRENSIRRRWELCDRKRGKTACRCPTPHQPLSHRDQIKSCQF